MSSRPPERDEMESLLDPIIALAHDLLKKHGEFFPFGATMMSDGEVALAAADVGEERPASQDVIDLLVGGMRAQAETGAIRAAGVCYDVRFQPEGGQKTDAIAVHLEHQAGDVALVMEPYTKGRFTGFKFGALVAVPPGDRRIFESSGPK